ncbi:MAG: SDR family NAD(P)-dependent oxidoreductase [Acidimicrobiaceae bacterium]|nr:SDR family NAD(P)-dependent oxidoreductase [Acidimicrobiaceae bacterium]
MDTKGISAVVSGAASGLGAATARKLVESGARVFILDRDEEKGKAFAKELGPLAEFLSVDVTDEDQVSQAMETAASSGPLRVAVSCAGIGIGKRVIDKRGEPHDYASFDRVLKVNLFGTFNIMRYAASQIARTEPLEHQERGVIVNTASIAAFDGQIGQLAYSASKGAIVGMTLPAARDLSAAGVRVVTIAPGIMDTPLLGSLPDEIRAALSAGVPFPHRLGTPSDYASLVLEIVRNGYLNGEVIRLDGALRMAPK